MKKLYMTSLLVTSSLFMYGSDYQSSIANALNQRKAGDSGYESGGETMKNIRNPRRSEVGAEQEASEYLTIKSSLPGFVADTPLQRFTIKADQYLDQVKSGKITPQEFVEMMNTKLTTYNKNMSK